ncbi:MAG: hypothetical protein R3C14_17350 [Caldilineaceae bacterium]
MTNVVISNLTSVNSAYSIIISLFGNFGITINGKPVNTFRSNKTRALLAYLLVEHAQPVLRTTLAKFFWPDYTDTSIRTNLRQTLADLRNALAPFELLQTDRYHVQVRPDLTVLWCDALQFDELVTSWEQHDHPPTAPCPHCREQLAKAIDLATGVFLENFPTIESAPFQAWLQSRRAYFAARLEEAQTALAQSKARVGYLPPPLTSLIGRADELTELAADLRHPTYRCLTLVGPGGIGKTRLARALGEQMADDFADGVWLVELAGLAPPIAAPTQPASPAANETATEQLQEQVAVAIGAVLGIAFYGANPPSVQVAAYLRDKTALLLLDSFEQVAPATALLLQLLETAPRLRLLITSRQRLPMQAQLVHLVDGLAIPPAETAAALALDPWITHYSSVQLFVERAQNAGFALPRAVSTLAPIGELCRLVAGSPWAIEVAVSMLDRQTPAALLAAIQDNYRALTTDLLDLPERQRSAESVFHTMWALLTPAEAQTLACCAVFHGGFKPAAAQTVAAATPAVLETLVHKSLLRREQGGRYAMHDLVRQFAGEQLAVDAAAADRAHAAHAAYFTALLATWQPDDATEQRFRTAVAQDWENVQAAWAWAVQTGQVALLQQGMAGLAEYYEIAGLFLEADRAFDVAVTRVSALLDATSATTGDAAIDIDKAPIQTLLAHLLWRRSHFLIAALGQIEEGQQLAEEVLAWGEHLHDATLTAWGYYELNVAALFQGDYLRQEELVRQAIRLAQQQGDQRAQANYLLLLAISLKMQQAFVAAAAAFEEALTLAQAVGSGRLALMIRSNLGSFHWETGNFTKAQEYLQQALTQAQARAQKDSATFATACLGALAQTLGDYANARAYCAAAHQGYVELGDKVLEAQLLNLLGALCIDMGELAAADDYCRRALASAVAQTYTVQREALMIQGQLQRSAGNWAAARTAYTAAYAVSQQTNLISEWLPIQAQLAALHLTEGETVAALAAIEPVLANFAEVQWSVAQRPQELLLIAYHILCAAQDPRAQAILHQAWQLVQEHVATIDDPRLRHTYRTNVPVNRELARLVEGETGDGRWEMGDFGLQPSLWQPKN